MNELARTNFRLIYRLRVRWAEVDLQRIVFNPHYLTYIDTAFSEYWRTMAVPYEQIAQTLGGELYVKKSTLEYHGSALLDDLLGIGVQCVRIGTSSMVFRCAVMRNGVLLVSGELIYVFADPATQTSKPVPPQLRELFQSFEAGESPIAVRVGSWVELEAQAITLRRAVFVDELGITQVSEQDPADDNAAHALVCNRMGLAVATGRLVLEGRSLARIARVAVNRTLRGTGLGQVVMRALMQVASDRGDTRVLLQAPCSSEGFYTRLGFIRSGESYEHAGMRHVDMARPLASL